MKKVQRSFAVEYKSGRRKIDVKPNSIWGSMDLKSVARDVENSAMPFLPKPPLGGDAGMEVSSPELHPVLAILTPSVATQKTTADTQEMFMADDTDTITNADAPAIDESEIAPKKQRKPRAKKTSREVAADVAAETAGSMDGVTKEKRGPKAKVVGAAAVAKRTPVKREARDEQTATVVPTSAGDEMADLLQLEEENQKLRKQLAEKLRAENADLRKKLKLD